MKDRDERMWSLPQHATASLICPRGTVCKIRAQERGLWEFKEDHMATRRGGWGASYRRWISAD